MEKTMAKARKQGPGKNDAAWDAVGHAAWLKHFPFVGQQGATFEAKAAIVPAAPGAITQGSSILLGLHFMTGESEGVNLTLSFDQARVVSEILRNFLVSRETAHEATRGAFVNPEGAVRWGTSPQAV